MRIADNQMKLSVHSTTMSANPMIKGEHLHAKRTNPLVSMQWDPLHPPHTPCTTVQGLWLQYSLKRRQPPQDPSPRSCPHPRQVIRRIQVDLDLDIRSDAFPSALQSAQEQSRLERVHLESQV